MNFDNKKIMPRFFVVIVLMSLGGLYILGNAAYLMFVESEYWTQVSRKLVKENVPIPAKRGNILSADGQIMASSLPEYKIYMDYVASDKNPETAKELQAWRDSVLIADLDSISQGLSKIFPDKTAGYFKKRLKKGKKLRRRNWQIYGRRIIRNARNYRCSESLLSRADSMLRNSINERNHTVRWPRVRWGLCMPVRIRRVTDWSFPTTPF